MISSKQKYNLSETLWEKLIKRNDHDAKVIKACLVKLRLIPYYEYVAPKEIYNDIVHDLP